MVAADEIASKSEAVAEAFREYLPVTPLVRFDAMSDEYGTELLVKCEHQQRTGSFKARGAMSKMLALSPEQRERGVVTASTGNHGRGVAHAIATLGGQCRVFVPRSADPLKVAAIERLGGRLEVIDSDAGTVEVIAREYANERELDFVSPYNDVDVIAGQGTIGVELVEQAGDAGLDAVFVSVGGGGLISGIASVLKAHWPDVRVIGASPENDAAMAVSVQQGEIVPVGGRPTLSDGTAGNVEPGSVTFGLCQSLVDDWVLVGEPEIAAALRSVIDTEHQLVEGAAGVAFAAARKYEPGFERIAVVACGGNISSATLVRALG
jgi:threonine dehydratase